MPNWCTNRVTISSNTEDDSQFKELVAKFQVERPFNEIYPMPDFKNVPNSKGELPIAEEIKNPAGELITVTYNFPDGKNDDRWYDWRNQNWGTKWDCYDLTIDEDELPNGFTAEFNTAWCPPEEVASAIKEQFDDLSVSWFYDEPGCEIAGYL